MYRIMEFEIKNIQYNIIFLQKKKFRNKIKIYIKHI